MAMVPRRRKSASVRTRRAVASALDRYETPTVRVLAGGAIEVGGLYFSTVSSAVASAIAGPNPAGVLLAMKSALQGRRTMVAALGLVVRTLRAIGGRPLDG